jgi:hypothetical protein
MLSLDITVQVYTVATVQRVLADLMDEAPAIMLFLKSLTRLEVLHWAPDAAGPELLFDCTVQVHVLLSFWCEVSAQHACSDGSCPSTSAVNVHGMACSSGVQKGNTAILCHIFNAASHFGHKAA